MTTEPMTTESTTTEPQPGSADAVVLARSVLESINARDIDAVTALLSPDYRAEWPDAELDLGGSFEREVQMMTGLPDTHFDIDRITRLDDGRVVVEATVTGTHDGPLELPHDRRLEPTGRKVRLQFLFLMTFADGLLTHERLFFDHHELIHQLTGP